MLYSLNSLKRFINISDSPENIANNLTLKTCEIEEIKIRKIPDSVVIGRCISVHKHPDADKLFVCQVDCGKNGKYQIITGGENIQADKFVAVALPGTFLPEINIKIESRTLKGIDSSGMIISKEEIGIKEDTDKHWIWLLEEEFNDLSDSDLGVSLGEKYEWLNSIVFDVDNKTLTNRPDLTGHLGVAIELNSIYGFHNSKMIKFNKINEIMATTSNTNMIDTLDNSQKSNRKIICNTDDLNTYIALELNNISVGKSDFYTRLSLMDLGGKSISNWIDFSNLFLYLTGQPIHFFDARKIDGDIIIRNAKNGEKFTDLFEIVHDLKEDDIVISDNNKILALAGIIGSNNSGIDENTKDIIVEIANFDPVKVRKTGTRLGIRTDAEIRFEKAISPTYSLFVLILFLENLKFYCNSLGGFTIGGLGYYIKDTVKSSIYDGKTIKIDNEVMSRFVFGDLIYGFVDDAVKILNGIGFDIEFIDGGFIVLVPIWRSPNDINIPEDIFEEITRIYGYEKIGMKPLKGVSLDQPYIPVVEFNRNIETILSERYGFDQVETYPWVSDQQIELFGIDKSRLFNLKNPLAPEISNLRHSMIYNMILSVERNFRFFDEIKIFDNGKIWYLGDGKIKNFMDTRTDHENQTLGIVYYRKDIKTWHDDPILYMKGVIEQLIYGLGINGKILYNLIDNQIFHPKRQGMITLNGIKIGVIGQLHPIYHDGFKFPEKSSFVFAELHINNLIELFSKQPKGIKISQYETLSDNIIYRDLSFVIDRIQDIGIITESVKKVKDVIDVEIFDIYEGENIPKDKKSISIKMKIIADSNIKTEQINAIMDRAIFEVDKVGGKLRM